MLQIKDLKKSYGGLSVLGGIHLSVKDGEIVALLGPSGCGKSTFLHTIAGLLRPDSGTVLLSDDKIGYIFQDDRLLPWRTVYENIRLVRDDDSPDEIRRLLRIVELEEFADYYPAQLSGGMRKRCGIARAFYSRCRLLLLDEPFGALDVRLKAEMHNLLLSIREETKTTMLFVSHDVDEALSIANRWIVFGNRPATVRKVFVLPESVTGSRRAARIAAIRRDILSLLQEEDSKWEAEITPCNF